MSKARRIDRWPRYTSRGPLLNSDHMYRRLDCGLSNDEWRLMFPDAIVKVGERWISEHPLLSY